MKVTQSHINHDKGRHNDLNFVARNDQKHHVAHQRSNHLVDPLDTDCELDQESTEQKGEEVTCFSMRKQIHDHTKGVAEKQAEDKVQSLNIKANGF